ncbi:hypothetical protein [Herminiimonas aquatilis]|uniref:Uncharacterized protein n=1 Tax=Herminiimonas aquatilis TaxID=345342 RepID=A0ABW2J3D2_9BURK
MSVPLISIVREQRTEYKWSLICGPQLLHSRFGQQDVTACLQSAGEVTPADQQMVEIMYRHVHMGTHLIKDLVLNAGSLAKHISETYATLIADKPASVPSASIAN